MAVDFIGGGYIPQDKPKLRNKHYFIKLKDILNIFYTGTYINIEFVHLNSRKQFSIDSLEKTTKIRSNVRITIMDFEKVNNIQVLLLADDKESKNLGVSLLYNYIQNEQIKERI